ncbi:hypothetical protein [Paraferrimonas sp. SM1919]|uniref:hypothetical protein n=1 Tax=Paraferrimonas sp. SM1919 TaxID=2662263 RepID=UPI0013D27942|nr:hypothetical protein [Paraferrimonas sp. SM1919]
MFKSEHYKVSQDIQLLIVPKDQDSANLLQLQSQDTTSELDLCEPILPNNQYDSIFIEVSANNLDWQQLGTLMQVIEQLSNDDGRCYICGYFEYNQRLPFCNSIAQQLQNHYGISEIIDLAEHCGLLLVRDHILKNGARMLEFSLKNV